MAHYLHRCYFIVNRTEFREIKFITIQGKQFINVDCKTPAVLYMHQALMKVVLEDWPLESLNQLFMNVDSKMNFNIILMHRALYANSLAGILLRTSMLISIWTIATLLSTYKLVLSLFM